MILARLDDVDRYLTLHRDFATAVAFLRSGPLERLAPGRIEIAGGVFAVVMRGSLRPRAEARLEAHRKYIDIQCPVSAAEEMGWRPYGRCRDVQSPYDAEKDVEFFGDAPASYVTVCPGSLAIFWPEDAHAPMIGVGEIHKIVVKVPC